MMFRKRIRGPNKGSFSFSSVKNTRSIMKEV